MSGWNSIRNASQAGAWFDGPNVPLVELDPMASILGGGQGVMGDLSKYLTGSMPALKTPGMFDGMKDFMGGFAGTRNADGSGTTGWGMPAISAAQGLMNAFMGMKNYGLAKDQFNFSKDMAQKNLANQTKTVNSQLEDRQRARVAANPTAYQSVDAYMKEKGL